MKRIKKPLEKEIQLIVARLIMNLQKDLFLSQPNRTHPESTALEYAEKTGLPYDDLLKYYTHPCTLDNEKEGEIAFEILAFKIKEKNMTRDQLYQLHFNVEGLISNKTMKKITLNLKMIVEDDKEIEKVCIELEKYFPNHNFHAIKKRIVPDGYKTNPNYGP